jgi:hypothetical protein
VGVLHVREREQALAERCAAEPGISPMQGKDPRAIGSGMNTRGLFTRSSNVAIKLPAYPARGRLFTLHVVPSNKSSHPAQVTSSFHGDAGRSQ